MLNHQYACSLVVSHTGFNPGGRNAKFWCVAHHVTLPATSRTVRVQWTRHQPAASELDVIVVRKEGAANSHRDFRVRRSVMLRALWWLLVNTKYYRNVCIDPDTLSMLPEDGDLTDLNSVTVQSTADDQELPSAEDLKPYDAHLSRTFVPNTVQRLTEQETFCMLVCLAATLAKACPTMPCIPLVVMSLIPLFSTSCNTLIIMMFCSINQICLRYCIL